MIIDFHTHCFPDWLAERACRMLIKNSGMVTPFHDGTVAGLRRRAADSGVDVSVVLNIATNPRQQKNVNDFAISLLGVKGIVPFGSVHPEAEDAFDELERLAASGIKGVKFHPDNQNFYVDEDRMIPIYEKIASLGLITLFHCGLDIGMPEPVHCTADRLARVLDVFGDAPVVAAHFGGICSWYATEKYLIGRNLYLDTAYSYGIMPPSVGKRLIAEHGADKILFGSDSPWNSPKAILRLIDLFELSDGEKEAVLGGNAQRLLNI